MPKANGEPFQIAFPCVTLPGNYGGRKAIILMSYPHPATPNVTLAICVDEIGQLHQHVPFVASEMIKAVKDNLAYFTEIQQVNAPKADTEQSRIIIP